MSRIPIPKGAMMRYRKSGRTLYAPNRSPIVWRTTPPPKGTEVYVIGWFSGQGSLVASRVETQQ